MDTKELPQFQLETIIKELIDNNKTDIIIPIWNDMQIEENKNKGYPIWADTIVTITEFQEDVYNKLLQDNVYIDDEWMYRRHNNKYIYSSIASNKKVCDFAKWNMDKEYIQLNSIARMYYSLYPFNKLTDDSCEIGGFEFIDFSVKKLVEFILSHQEKYDIIELTKHNVPELYDKLL